MADVRFQWSGREDGDELVHPVRNGQKSMFQALELVAGGFSEAEAKGVAMMS
jgi:hypothetical protein